MYKSIGLAPAALPAKNVIDICSAGKCGGNPTNDFYEYPYDFAGNGYWFFNKPEDLKVFAAGKNIDLTPLQMFYFEAFDREFDLVEEQGVWATFSPDESFEVEVKPPDTKTTMGYDVTEYVCRGAPECSLLACSNLTARYAVNSHCLFESFEEAKTALESGAFHEHEPGPYRIIAVFSVP